MRNVAPALLAPAGLVFVRNEAVHANTQVSPQAPFLRIELFKQFALQHFDKESLCEVLCLLGRTVPAQAHVFVDRPPVCRAERFERAHPLFRVDAAYRFDHRPPRQRKAVTAGLKFFFVHAPGPLKHIGKVVKVYAGRSNLTSGGFLD